MTEHVVNGNFAAGLSGWSSSSACPPGFWEAGSEEDPPGSGLFYAWISSFVPGCISRLDQSVDFTNVETLKFDARLFPGYWSGTPGWCRVYIEDSLVYQSTGDVPEMSAFEIDVTGIDGVKVLSFRVYGPVLGLGMDITNVSAFGDDLIHPIWQQIIGPM